MADAIGDSSAIAGQIAGNAQELAAARQRLNIFIDEQVGILNRLKTEYDSYRLANQSTTFGGALDNKVAEIMKTDAKLRETASELAGELGVTAVSFDDFSTSSVMALNNNVAGPGVAAPGPVADLSNNAATRTYDI